MKARVYLGGHIVGLSYDEIMAWQDKIKSRMPHQIECVSPMRDKECLKGMVITTEKTSELQDHLFVTYSGIVARDKFDIRNCDAMIANFDLRPLYPSIGTISEVAIAYELKKPVIVIMSDLIHNVNNHPFVMEEAAWIVGTPEKAADVVRSLFGFSALDKGLIS